MRVRISMRVFYPFYSFHVYLILTSSNENKKKSQERNQRAASPNFYCENCRAIYYCSDECRIASTSGRNGDHDRNACMRLAEEVSLFEQLVKKTEGGAEDELLGVQESACIELKRLGVHKQRDYRRECSCFDFVPFGELVYNELHSVSTYEEYIASELQYFRKLLREVNEGDAPAADWVQKHARVDHLPFSIAQNILKFNLDVMMESSVLRVYIAGCEKEFDTFERVAKKYTHSRVEMMILLLEEWKYTLLVQSFQNDYTIRLCRFMMGNCNAFCSKVCLVHLQN